MPPPTSKRSPTTWRNCRRQKNKGCPICSDFLPRLAGHFFNACRFIVRVSFAKSAIDHYVQKVHCLAPDEDALHPAGFGLSVGAFPVLCEGRALATTRAQRGVARGVQRLPYRFSARLAAVQRLAGDHVAVG